MAIFWIGLCAYLVWWIMSPCPALADNGSDEESRSTDERLRDDDDIGL